MISAPLPANEAARLAALESFDILDTDREQAYDDFTTLAAQICGTPMALIGLIDDQRQWFKSKIGLDGDETPRDLTFCGHAIADNQLLVVGDALEDRRFHDHPMVLGDPKIRFYAAAPIVTAEGHGLGTLCVIDRVPRTLSSTQRYALNALSRQVMSHLELRRALIALREAEQVKINFVANVSHELRTPLTSIRGALALVRAGEPQVDVEAWELLAAAHRNAERLLLLVNDLLDLERVGRGELPLQKADCDLAAVIAGAVDVVQTMAASAGVPIVVHAPPIALHADAGRLGQVVSNVIANAIRYSPRGGTITLMAERVGSRARVTIDDQGPGVPIAYRVTIFEPFKQVEGSAAHKKGGTGLGLAIARALLERHGGVIAVGDAPGGGARFTMELPLRSS